MQKGSITIFFSLVLVSMCSLLFSSIETLRVMSMKIESRAITQGALASAFSEYNAGMWDTYGILALDGCYGATGTGVNQIEERMMTFAWDNCESQKKRSEATTDFLHLNPTTSQLTNYMLLTDANAYPFVRQGVEKAKSQLTEKALEEIKQYVLQIEALEGEAVDVDKDIAAAEEAMENAEDYKTDDKDKQVKKTKTVADGGEGKDISSEEVNPISLYKTIKENGWLALVLDQTTVSGKTINTADLVSTRKIEQGTIKISADNNNVVDTLLFEWYLLENYSLFGKEKEGRCLDYEVEYIIAGKASDKENLENVVMRIMALREIENLATILSNPPMMQQAYEIAIAIAGVTVSPTVITLVQLAIVAVWAFVESILDLRTLLSGGKVPLIKTYEQWTSNLQNLGQCLSSSVKAKESETGMTYEYYLAAFLFLLNKSKRNMRPLDVMEKTIQMQEDYANVKMDHMVCEAEMTMIYEGSPVFGMYLTDTAIDASWYDFPINEKITYL